MLYQVQGFLKVVALGDLAGFYLNYMLEVANCCLNDGLSGDS